MLLGERVLRLGYEVMLTKDGADAWDVLQFDYYPIVISDVMMPNIDGTELCRLLRASDRPQYTYVILLTAQEASKESYMAGMNAGADDFMIKPCDMDQLMARLRVAERILTLQGRVRQLEGILPICMNCKNIRDEGEHWVRLENYIMERTDTLFSHGLCPGCLETMMAQLPANRR